MPLARVGSLVLQQSTLSNATRKQVDIFNKQIQISSGLKTSDFSGLSGEIEIFTSLEARINRASQYKVNNTQLQGRLQESLNAVQAIIDTANEFKNLILQRRNGAIADSLEFELRTNTAYRTVADQLNKNISGRYLFSGSRTDTPPVDASVFPTAQELGVPDASYYRGDSEILEARIKDDFLLEYNTRADDPAVQNVIAGIVLARQAHIEDNDELLQDAYDLMQAGVGGMIDMQSNITSNYSIIDDVSEQLESQSIYWKTVKEEAINADVVTLSTEVAVDQAVLQATFQVFARINSLQLSDFLR